MPGEIDQGSGRVGSVDINVERLTTVEDWAQEIVGVYLDLDRFHNSILPVQDPNKDLFRVFRTKEHVGELGDEVADLLLNTKENKKRYNEVDLSGGRDVLEDERHFVLEGYQCRTIIREEVVDGERWTAFYISFEGEGEMEARREVRVIQLKNEVSERVYSLLLSADEDNPALIESPSGDGMLESLQEELGGRYAGEEVETAFAELAEGVDLSITVEVELEHEGRGVDGVEGVTIHLNRIPFKLTLTHLGEPKEIEFLVRGDVELDGDGVVRKGQSQWWGWVEWD